MTVSVSFFRLLNLLQLKKLFCKANSIIGHLHFDSEMKAGSDLERTIILSQVNKKKC